MLPSRRGVAVLVVGAIAWVATGCGSSLGYNTPCSVWVSMDNGDQQSTVISLFEQQGDTTYSTSDVSQFQNRASVYCANPVVNQPTIIGMLDSRAQ
jgi:hypothetical protein